MANIQIQQGIDRLSELLTKINKFKFAYRGENLSFEEHLDLIYFGFSTKLDEDQGRINSVSDLLSSTEINNLIAAAKSSINGANATKTITEIETILTDYGNRIAALEATTLDKFVKGTWRIKNGNITPTNSPTATDDVAKFTIPTTDDDGTAITRKDGDIINFNIEGNATSIGNFKVSFDIVAKTGTIVPTVIEAISVSGVEILAARMDFNTNELEVIRNSGTTVDFSSLKITSIQQELFAFKTDLATLADLTQYALKTELNPLQEKNSASLGSITGDNNVENSIKNNFNNNKATQDKSVEKADGTNGKLKDQTEPLLAKDSKTIKDINDAQKRKADKGLEYNVDFNATGTVGVPAYTLFNDDDFVVQEFSGVGTMFGIISLNATSVTGPYEIEGFIWPQDSSNKLKQGKLTVTPNGDDLQAVFTEAPQRGQIIEKHTFNVVLGMFFSGISRSIKLGDKFRIKAENKGVEYFFECIYTKDNSGDRLLSSNINQEFFANKILETTNKLEVIKIDGSVEEFDIPFPQEITIWRNP